VLADVNKDFNLDRTNEIINVTFRYGWYQLAMLSRHQRT